MFRTVSVGQKAGISAAVLGLAFTILLGGCSSSTDTSAIPPPTVPAASAPQSASEPAVVEKLSFNQLKLDSTVKHITKNGSAKYLSFVYTDNDGKVYKCEMPEAMSQGTYDPNEWVRTFNIYRLPTVIKQRKVVKRTDSQNVEGFPFISPKQSTAPAAAQATPSAPQPVAAPSAPRPAAPVARPSAPRPSAPIPTPAPAAPSKPATGSYYGP